MSEFYNVRERTVKYDEMRRRERAEMNGARRRSVKKLKIESHQIKLIVICWPYDVWSNNKSRSKGGNKSSSSQYCTMM